MPHDLSLFSVNAVLILSASGDRILTKYYTPPHTPAGTKTPYATPKEQRPFETGLVSKTAKSASDIVLYDNHIAVYRSESDVLIYVVGGPRENELLLWNTLLAIRDALLLLLRNALDKRTILENYDVVALAIEEVIDDGIILETDPATIASRVSRPPLQDSQNPVKGLDLSEQGLLNAWEFGKKQLAERLRQGL